MSIRKFVGYAGAAAGIGAALVIAISTQTGIAATSAPREDQDSTTTTQLNVSQDCINAVKALRDAVIAGVQEDRLEYANEDTSATGDAGEDSTEIAALKLAVTTARSACLPPAAATTSTGGGAPVAEEHKAFAPNQACATAVANLKSAWAQGRPTTQTQWAQLQSLFAAARAACGSSFRG